MWVKIKAKLPKLKVNAALCHKTLCESLCLTCPGRFQMHAMVCVIECLTLMIYTTEYIRSEKYHLKQARNALGFTESQILVL